MKWKRFQKADACWCVELILECKSSRGIFFFRVTCLQNRCVYTISRISTIVFIILNVIMGIVINILGLVVEMQAIEHNFGFKVIISLFPKRGKK